MTSTTTEDATTTSNAAELLMPTKYAGSFLLGLAALML